MTAITDALNPAVIAAVIERSNERDMLLNLARNEFRRGYESGYPVGYDEGYNQRIWDYFRPDLSPSYLEYEERRYGPLPAGFTEPEHEEHPGQARRVARAAAPRPGDFRGVRS